MADDIPSSNPRSSAADLSRRAAEQRRYADESFYRSQWAGSPAQPSFMRRAASAASVVGGLAAPFSGSAGPMYMPQGIMALGYHAGAGQFLNSVTMGLLGRTAGFSQGLPPGVLSQLAADELSIRGQEFVGGFGGFFSGVGGLGDLAAGGLRASRQRQIATMLSSVAFSPSEGGTAIGFGLRSTSSKVKDLAGSMDSVMKRVFDESEFSMSMEDLRQLQSAAIDSLGTVSLTQASRESPQEVKRRLEQSVSSIKRISETLNLSYEAVGDAVKSIKFALDPGDNRNLAELVLTDRISGLSNVANVRYTKSALAAARSMGALDAGEAAAIRGSAARQMEGLFEMTVSGSLSKSLLSAFGGTSRAEQRANFQAALFNQGLNFGFQSPGITSLYQNRSPAINQMMAGDMGLFDFMSAGAASAVSDPFGLTAARYDPTTMNRMRMSGPIVAFSAARKQAELVRGMFPGMVDDARGRAIAIQQFQRMTGTGTEAEAIATYDSLAGLRAELIEKTGKGGAYADKALAYAWSTMSSNGAGIDEVVAKLNDLERAGIDPSQLKDYEILATAKRPRGDSLTDRVREGLRSMGKKGSRQGSELFRVTINRLVKEGLISRGKGAYLKRVKRDVEKRIRMANSPFNFSEYPIKNDFSQLYEAMESPEIVEALGALESRYATTSRSIVDSGIAGSYLMAGLDGSTPSGSAGVAMSLLTENEVAPASLNMAQRRLASFFSKGKDGYFLDLNKVLRQSGSGLVQQVLMDLSGNIEDIKPIREIDTEAEIAEYTKRKGIRLNSPVVLDAFFSVYANYHKDSISAMARGNLGTKNFPMYVRVTDGGGGSLEGSHGAN